MAQRLVKVGDLVVRLYPTGDEELGVVGQHSDHKDVLVVLWSGCDCRRWTVVEGYPLTHIKPRVVDDTKGKLWLWLHNR